MAKIQGVMLVSLILNFSAQHKVPPEIVYGVIMVESNTDANVARSEQYRWLYNVREQKMFRELNSAEVSQSYAPSDFKAISPCSANTEWNLQRTSLGLMQVMGANLRILGYKGAFLSEFTDPALAVEYGCKWLAHIAKAYNVRGDWSRVLSIYNSGSPSSERGKAYAAKVQVAARTWPDMLEAIAERWPELMIGETGVTVAQAGNK